MVVLVEGQENEGEGYFAVPVTKEVLAWYFSEGKGNHREEK